jgi:transposase
MNAIEQLEAAGEVLSPAVRTMILTLEARIVTLEARLAGNSRNSSRPPSADPPGTARTKKKRSGKRRGGQKGHPGHHRAMLPPERVDEVVVYQPLFCPCCGYCLAGTAAQEPVFRHQVVELPPIRAQVVEHQAPTLCCPGCGASSRLGLPEELGHKRFGPRLSALAVLLNGRFRMSRRNQCTFFTDLLDVPAPSLGMTQRFVDEAALALKPAYQEIRTTVRQSPAAAVDETGWRLREQTRWLWTAVTPEATLFRLGRGRSARELARLLGRDYAGLLSSDRWSAYKRHPLGERQLCWAHLKRNFEGLSLHGAEGQHFGRWGAAECDRLFHGWQAYARGETDQTGLRKQIRPVRARLRRLLTAGAVCAQPKVAAMCRNLLELWPALWRFSAEDALEAGLEPTNNAAERALRPAVLWRKSSFGSQSGKGLRATERLLSVTETARQHGLDLLDYLSDAITAHRCHEPAPHLLPAT